MDTGARRCVTFVQPGHIRVSSGINDKRQPSPLSHWASACDGCNDGGGHRLLLWSAHASCRRQNESFLAIFQYEGRERSLVPPLGQKIRFAGFTVSTRWWPVGWVVMTGSRLMDSTAIHALAISKPSLFIKSWPKWWSAGMRGIKCRISRAKAK